MVRSWLESGEVILRRRLRRLEDGLAVPLQVQILEADQLDGSREEVLGDSGARIVQGVEFDAIERIVAYWLLRSHPGESTIGLRSLGNTSIRVSSSDVAHLFEPTRPGQTRGIPWLTPGMRRFRELDSYEDAELMRKRVEACVSAFVTSDEAEEEGIAAKVTDSDGKVLETLEPGTVAYLRGGKTITFNSPSTVGGYADFKRAEIQSIAVAAGLTYELVSGDLSRVNYSSIRAGLIEFRRLVRNLRTNFVIPMACDPVWRWFVEAGIASGALPLPAGRTAAEVYPVRWGAARFEEVDRAKEAKADLEELTSGVATYPEILARRGEDWIEVLDEHVRFKAEAEARGLSFPFMAPAPAPAMDEEDPDSDDSSESEVPP
jgi:lambda family phage portal protein